MNKQLMVDIAEAMNWDTKNKDHELYTSFKDICDLVITEDDEMKADKGDFYYSKINDYIDTQRLAGASKAAMDKLAAFKKKAKL